MNLSDAIRLGSMLGPQAYGDLSRTRRKYLFFGPVVHEYCAMGAAFAATGAQTVRRTHETAGETHGGFRGSTRLTHKAGQYYYVVEHQWDTLMWMTVSCPTCTQEQCIPLHRLIPHMNDIHRHSREYIADFVEMLEQRQEQLERQRPAEHIVCDNVLEEA